MHNYITIGKTVIADSQAEAKELFRNRLKLGIGGVIFTPEFEIPKWSNDDKIRMSKLYCEVETSEELEAKHLADVEGWVELAQTTAKNLYALSKEFNPVATARRMRFLWNDDFDLKPHFDLGAMDGWLHLHVSGNGMQCANPVGDEPVKVLSPQSFGENIDCDDYERLITIERKIEIVTPAEGQAVIFDHTMAHKSSQGQRFRIPIIALG